jgi:hypothetical protein
VWGAKFEINRINTIYECLGLVKTDQFFEAAAYLGGQSQFAITEGSSTSETTY